MATFSIEYRPETADQGGPFEVKQGTGHARLYATAERAYAFVVSNSDARVPHVDWINVQAHVQEAAVASVRPRYG